MSGTQFVEKNRRLPQPRDLHPSLFPVDPHVLTAEELFFKRPAGLQIRVTSELKTLNTVLLVSLLANPYVAQAIIREFQQNFPERTGGVAYTTHGVTDNNSQDKAINSHPNSFAKFSETEILKASLLPNFAPLLPEIIKRGNDIRQTIISYQAPDEILAPILRFKEGVNRGKNKALTITEKAAVYFSDIAYRSKLGDAKSLDEKYKDTPKDLVDEAVKIAGLDNSKLKITGMHQLFAVQAVKVLKDGNFNLARIFKELSLNIVRNKSGEPIRLNADDKTGEITSTILSDEQVSQLLSNFGQELSIMQNQTNDSHDQPDNLPSNGEEMTALRAWSPEERAQATIQAVESFQTSISSFDIPNYDLVILTTTIPITADQIALAEGLKGVELILDAAGNVVALAVHTGISAMVIPGLILGVGQDVVEGHPEYTTQELAQIRAAGWRQVIFNDVSSSQGMIKDTKGQVIARIVDSDAASAANEEEQSFTSDGENSSSRPPDKIPTPTFTNPTENNQGKVLYDRVGPNVKELLQQWQAEGKKPFTINGEVEGVRVELPYMSYTEYDVTAEEIIQLAEAARADGMRVVLEIGPGETVQPVYSAARIASESGQPTLNIAVEIEPESVILVKRAFPTKPLAVSEKYSAVYFKMNALDLPKSNFDDVLIIGYRPGEIQYIAADSIGLVRSGGRLRVLSPQKPEDARLVQPNLNELMRLYKYQIKEFHYDVINDTYPGLGSLDSWLNKSSSLWELIFEIP